MQASGEEDLYWGPIESESGPEALVGLFGDLLRKSGLRNKLPFGPYTWRDIEELGRDGLSDLDVVARLYFERLRG